MVEKLVPELFSKKSEILQFVFSLWSSRGIPKYIETKVLNSYFYLIQSFLKNKRSGTSHPA